jgi:putative ABC transport system ATP-binding protein
MVAAHSEQGFAQPSAAAAQATMSTRSHTLTDALLAAQGLGRSFAYEHIFADLSFKLTRGMSAAVVGPSGAGKSTLLSVLGLLLNKTAGNLAFYNKDVENLNASDLARHRRLNIGFVFQHTQLLGSLRALDNVLIGKTLLRRQDNQSLRERFASDTQHATLPNILCERAEELLTSFALTERRYHFPHQMSVGQKRRVAVARALLLKPPLILADEPTNDLDAASAKLVASALFSAVEQGQTLVYATHDEGLASRADMIIELSDRSAS